MMTSENSLEQVYVWIWLPGATEPVVAGVLSRDNGRFIFNYLPQLSGAERGDSGLCAGASFSQRRNCTCPWFANGWRVTRWRS